MLAGSAFPVYTGRMAKALPTVHVLYENPAWLPPLQAALEAEGFPYRLIEVWKGTIDTRSEPEEGIYWNRMSPSSHTRGHHESVALMREWLLWLEAWGRRVINGSRAFDLEVSKLQQDLVLNRYGIRTPRTVLTVGRDEILAAAKTFDGPFITKHNQGGKGLGIRLFEKVEPLARYLDSPEFDAGPNGQVVLQEYIRAPQPFITRIEIVGGRFLFSMRSSTVSGFELCPSDACHPTVAQSSVCPADGSTLFSRSPVTADDPLVRQYLELCRGEGIEVAGIEFVEDADGRRYTYDINGNSNYSGVFGREIGIDGMREVAHYLKTVVVPALESGIPRRVAHL